MSLRRLGGLTELLGWMALGVSAGVTLGLLLGERLETPRPRAPLPDDGHPSGAAGSSRTLQRSLADHTDFGTLDLTVRPVTPGVVELIGWVQDRATRAEVMRFARNLPGIDNVHDRLLVHGEDDLAGGASAPSSTLT
jgi:hypothetical protein